MSDEFESRENELIDNDPVDNGLGELSPTHLRERGEQKHFRGNPSVTPPHARPIGTPRPAGHPPDVASQDALKQQPAEAGTMSIGSATTTTFDARPINAIDFYKTGFCRFGGFVAANGGPGNNGVTTVTFSFIVPQARVAILRAFGFYMPNPDTAMEESALSAGSFPGTFTDNIGCDSGALNAGREINRADQMATATVFVNGVPDNQFVNVFVGTGTGRSPREMIQCYILADEGQEIKLSICAQGFKNVSSTFDVYPILYGNLLLTRSVPLEFQPGNIVPSSPIYPEFYTE